MSSLENIQYHGLLLPPVAHTKESLEYAENFVVKDTDVFAVTYPKSGEFVLFFFFLANPLFCTPVTQFNKFT